MENLKYAHSKDPTLKPCPFCGGEAHCGPQSYASWTVSCKKCNSRGSVYGLPEFGDGKTDYDKLGIDLAVNAWNNRI